MVTFILSILAALSGFCFLLAGIQDYKFRRVSDLITSTMWVLLFLAGSVDPSMFYVAIASFSLMFMANTLYLNRKRTPAFGWGDILVAPVFAAWIFTLVNFWIAAGILVFGLMLPYIQYVLHQSFVKRKDVTWQQLIKAKMDVPMVSNMAVAFGIALIGAII